LLHLYFPLFQYPSYLQIMNQPAADRLLIADPFLKDEHFMRTVVYLCSHSNEGSLGFTLNRPFTHNLDQLMDGIEVKGFPVSLGGPVGLSSIHFIHSLQNLIPDTEMLNDNIGWGGNFDVVRKLINERKITPQQIRFFVGYSGWSAGQLEEEMAEKTWLISKAPSSILFSLNQEDCWKNSIRLLGSEYEPLINYPIDPQLN